MWMCLHTRRLTNIFVSEYLSSLKSTGGYENHIVALRNKSYCKIHE